VNGEDVIRSDAVVTPLNFPWFSCITCLRTEHNSSVQSVDPFSTYTSTSLDVILVLGPLLTTEITVTILSSVMQDVASTGGDVYCDGPMVFFLLLLIYVRKFIWAIFLEKLCKSILLDKKDM